MDQPDAATGQDDGGVDEGELSVRLHTTDSEGGDLVAGELFVGWWAKQP